MEKPNKVYLSVKEILGSKEYDPLTKFFMLLRMDSIIRAENNETKQRIWNKVESKMRDER